jgi:Uma2 family endonuclease
MATILEPTAGRQREQIVPRGLVNGEQRLVVYSNWAGYERFLEARGVNYPRLRITYDRGRLEFMTTSGPHERFKKFLVQFLELATIELNIPLVGYGQATLRRQDLDRGMEPDEWFYIEHASQMTGIRDLDFTRDPPPDLAIEIEVSRSILDRIDISRAIGIRELWRYDGQTLRVMLLQSDGTYSESPTSRALPQLPLAEFARRVGEAAASVADDTTLARGFQNWVRQTLVPPQTP